MFHRFACLHDAHNGSFNRKQVKVKNGPTTTITTKEGGKRKRILVLPVLVNFLARYFSFRLALSPGSGHHSNTIQFASESVIESENIRVLNLHDHVGESKKESCQITNLLLLRIFQEYFILGKGE